MGDSKKLFKEYITRIKIFIKSFNQARSRILYSIFGNLFPIILGPFVLFFIKENFCYSELLTSQNLIIYSATFAISSMFIWKSYSSNKKDLDGMLFYIILILIITSLFAVSYVDYFHKEIFNIVTKSVFVFTIFLYTYQEIYTVYIINKNPDIKDERKRDIKDLENDFDKLNTNGDGE